jgi:hypothetical protein
VNDLAEAMADRRRAQAQSSSAPQTLAPAP